MNHSEDHNELSIEWVGRFVLYNILVLAVYLGTTALALSQTYQVVTRPQGATRGPSDRHLYRNGLGNKPGRK